MDTKELSKEAFEGVDITKTFNTAAVETSEDKSVTVTEHSAVTQKRVDKTKAKKAPFNIKMGQFIYLSFTTFSKNKLWESASSCAFGFVFSFVPIVLIVLTIILSVLRRSPDLTFAITDVAKELFPIYDMGQLIDNLLQRHRFNALDVVLGIWVIWMARKLFLSIIQGMTRIFGAVSTRKNWFNQVLTFISEFALIFVISVITIFAFTLTQLADISSNSPRVNLPRLFSTGSGLLAELGVYIILFICTFSAYKFLSGTKPGFRKCCIFAAIDIFTFFIASAFLNVFINKTNYNIIYGTLSTLILMMVKVYLFFFLFLFFAQMIYVSQFFDQLLKSQLYFLPEDQDENLFKSFTRILFINPSILQNEENTNFYKAGEQIFTKGERVNCVYYLRKGIIEEKKGNERTFIEHGTLIGDTLCILNEKYTTSACALTDCEILEFTADEFMKILQADSNTATLAVSKVFDYTGEMRK